MEGITKREFMQHQGRLIRGANLYALLEEVQQKMDMNEYSSYLFNGSLITDVRMEHEAEWVRNKGGTVIHIHRPDAEAAPEDETEQTLLIEKGDLLIKNNGSLKGFNQKFLCAISEIKSRYYQGAA